jgi:DNA-binding beta-propeller fold protein YncE
MRCSPRLAAWAACLGWAVAHAEPTLTADGLETVSSPATPAVAYRVERTAEGISLLVAVEPFQPGDSQATIGLDLGLAADREIRRTEADATSTPRPAGGPGAEGWQFLFRVPAADLWTRPTAPNQLRLAWTVTWKRADGSLVRQLETFRDRSVRAGHAGLGPAAGWQPVSLDDWEAKLKDREQAIAIDFPQPIAGKATIVIDDADGRRVRNLRSAADLPAGRHLVGWDARGDDGRLMPPGRYRWRSVSHAGLRAEPLFSFCDAPGSNHGTFHTAATDGSSLFFGTPVSEGGHQIVELTAGGEFVRGYNAPHGQGLDRLGIAADDRFIYAVYDGGSGGRIDRSRPDWRADQRMTLVRFDRTTGGVAALGGQAAVELRRYAVGPGSPERLPDGPALAGVCLAGGRLYVADRVSGEVLEIDPGTGEVTRRLPLAEPVALAASGDFLWAIAGDRLVEIDGDGGGVKRTLCTLPGRPQGLAFGADGRVFVSDGEAQTVRIFGRDGRPAGVLGKPGGVSPGPYDPLRMHNPAGLVVSSTGAVWVTESGRWTPKRLVALDPASGSVVAERFGPTAYGASNSGFDPDDPSRWIGQGTLFSVDYEAQTARPRSILGGFRGRSYRFWRQDGRTFVISCDKATCVQELLADGTLRPLALVSAAHLFSVWQGWWPPEAFVEAFNRDHPGREYRAGTHGKPDHGIGMLWVDTDGDGSLDAAEIQFTPPGNSIGAAYWGNDQHDLTLRVPAVREGKGVLLTLRPDGWHPGGAPKYPALADAIRAAPPIDLDVRSSESTVDGFGTLVVNSDPVMKAFAADGRLAWTYPNRWVGVHGSHRAPLPTPGELQGVMFFTGVAPLDSQGDVMAMNGNHGRVFFMTTDGMYLDELFPDVRLMTNPQAGGIGVLGQEPFGGTFNRAGPAGPYLFQGGGIAYRIYRVHGLEGAVRQEGEFEVTAPQVAAAERTTVRGLTATQAPRTLRVPGAVGADKATAPAVIRWDREGRFPAAVECRHDGEWLHLTYAVDDDSPWVNRGSDWQTLFKTGDSVDLQLGTDPAADPGRSTAAVGDLRLLVAPWQETSLAVLYKHRLPGATDGVEFQSPWRTEKVDSVKRLDSARIAVERAGKSYRVQVAVPLAELGLTAAAFGKPLRGDFGVIYGDAAGTTNVLRSYWSNRATGLVSDVPGEIMLTPSAWGEIMLEPTP